jgi:hypothetical protein
MKMFDSQISPIIEYASEVWYNNKDLAELEKIHLAFMKNTLKIKTSSSTLAVYAELGRFPIDLKIKCRLLKYWQQIVNLIDTHPVKLAYQTLLELNNRGQTNWCTTVKNILTEAGAQAQWGEQNINIKQYNQIKENMYRNYMRESLDKINDSDTNPKLRTYKLFKSEYKMEPYLTSLRNVNHMLALTRLRISSHNLAIETGRYTQPKTPIGDRKCIHCNNNAIEDEEHFLLSCPLYERERLELIGKINTELPHTTHENDHQKFISIMSSTNTTVVNAIGKFVYNSMKKRNEN